MDSVELDSKLAALQVQKAALVRQMVVTDAAISATTAALKLCKREEVKAEYEAEAAKKGAVTAVKMKKKKRKRLVASSSSCDSSDDDDDSIEGDGGEEEEVASGRVGGGDAGVGGAGAEEEVEKAEELVVKEQVMLTRQNFLDATCVMELPIGSCRACFRMVRNGIVGTHTKGEGLCLKWGVVVQRGRPPKKASA